MASNTKTPAEVAQELAKALGAKLDDLRKMDLPKTDDAANGGQESKGKIPSMPKQAGGTTDAEMAKEEIVATKKVTCPGCDRKTAVAHEGENGRKVVALCPACKKRNVGNVKKMDLPHSDEAANGGKINAEEARKKEMSSEETPLSEESSATEVHENMKSEGIRPAVKESMDQAIASYAGKKPKPVAAPIKKNELDALDVAQALSKAVVDKIATMREQLVKMEQLEKAGNASMKKAIGTLAPQTPAVHQMPTQDVHTQHNIFSILGKGDGALAPWAKKAKKGQPKPGKEHEADDQGSGGLDTMKGSAPKGLEKGAMGMQPAKVAVAAPAATLKPAGIPGAKAGDAPKAPKAPQAPGAMPAAKMELPQSEDAANGGQESKGSIPSMPKQSGGTTDAEVNKMDLPHSSTKANGGQMKKDDIGMGTPLSNSEVPAILKNSPVFGTKPGHTYSRHTSPSMGPVEITTPVPKLKVQGGVPAHNAGASAAPTMAHTKPMLGGGTGTLPAAGHPGMHNVAGSQFANSGALQGAATMHIPGGAMPTKASHAPMMSKDEMDLAKCPKCKSGMTKCKCG